MKIKLLTSMSGVMGSFGVGEIVELDDVTGQRFVAGGLGVAAAEAKPEPVSEPVVTSEPVKPRGKRGKSSNQSAD